ncbi:TonB-dependent receptor [Elizabethkingia sp. JS20170427COW]|uniref:TonB-dependent receptor n=1 Tax=Elizabethkingia sp. JS20170427COW TaxID=2583851 RepID=UPI0011101E3F|nr:TonB-dependent receptor [Elizabethkingia sp. JS20170427COW]QCX53255.1 TonB-dependent receptor [Elizabethkingia sp. JS20170427COW]
MKGFIFLGLCISPFYFAQQVGQDSIKTQEISGVKLLRKLPVTKEIINVKRDLDNRNLGQDLPILLKNQTSVETTSDAGNGVGYTGLKIRGVDGTRINIMLNGVPFNDSESQGAFFVNTPDITSSASNIVIQRGVGTSSNGVASFGASVNILTQEPSEKSYFSTQNSVGSFNTHKHSFEVGTGSLLNGKLSMMARYSIIKSDGYIDRAFSDLSSYNFTAVYKNGNTKLKFMTFGGKEKTYQAWNGISKEQYETNPTYNSSGEIYDANGNIVGYYNNETDNYKQQHYHLLWEQRFNDQWNLNTTLHYTKGQGYYDNYKSDQKFSKYGLPALIVNDSIRIERGDLIRQKWMDNHFYGVVSELNGQLERWNLNFGVVANQYYGDHFGRITSGSNLQQVILPFEYYRNHAIKNEVSGYAKALYKIDNFEVFGDLQLRHIDYKSKVDQASLEEAPEFSKKYSFFNPKVGVNYHLGAGVLYLSYANAHREPVRSDLKENNEIRPEQLHDFELGYHHNFGDLYLSANLYYMLYRDQLVLTGALNDVGAHLHQNVGKSYRRGLEISAKYRLNEKWNALANLAFSQNKNKDYKIETANGTESLGNTTIAFSPNFIGNFTLNYLPVKNLELSWSHKAVGKQYINNTQTEEFKLKPYYLSDFVATYKTQWGKTDIGLHLMVNNIFNTRYTNYGADYGVPYYYAQARANFLAGVSLRFN